MSAPLEATLLFPKTGRCDGSFFQTLSPKPFPENTQIISSDYFSARMLKGEILVADFSVGPDFSPVVGK
jgi:hypothetical protein